MLGREAEIMDIDYAILFCIAAFMAGYYLGE